MVIKYHVHIYKVVEMFECDIKVEDAIEARQKALDLVEGNKLKSKKPDCKFLALSFTRKT